MEDKKCNWHPYDTNIYKEGMTVDEYNKAFDEYWRGKLISTEIVTLEYKVDEEIDPDEFEKLFGEVIK